MGCASHLTDDHAPMLTPHWDTNIDIVGSKDLVLLDVHVIETHNRQVYNLTSWYCCGGGGPVMAFIVSHSSQASGFEQGRCWVWASTLWQSYVWHSLL